MTIPAGFNLIENYVRLEADGGAVTEEVSAEFWSQIGSRP
jgi:hypothetical protein